MYSKVQPSISVYGADDEDKLPTKPVPGETGIPFFSPIRDRLDYYYFQGEEKFFQSRMDRYGSTVFRVNMPPGPFMAKDPRVICILDAASFPVLFDMTKVEKKDLFTGTYMPPTSITGGYRVCSYLDPSEPNHTKIKNLLFNMLASRKSKVIPVFHSVYTTVFETIENQLVSSKKSDFNKLNDTFAFEYLCEAYFGSDVHPDHSLPTKVTKWLFFQLHPLIALGFSKILEELLLHTFHLPPLLVKSDYKKLYNFFSEAAGPSILDHPDKLQGLSREEACHNLLFATCFNSYGGMKVLFPSIMSRLAKLGADIHKEIYEEVRSAVRRDGGKITLSGLEKMNLVQSVVYEVMRIDPPVRFQYGRAKTDFLIRSHDAAFQVKKGEMVFGYQPFATRDGKVFYDADKFVYDRFASEKGKNLLKYVVWSNGPETEKPTVGNKQCAGKEFVVLIARLLVAEFFLRYDTFTAEVGTNFLGINASITSLTKATTKAN